MFDPFANRPKHTREELAGLFKGPSAVLQRLRAENAPLYRECRAEAEQYGLLGPASYVTVEERAQLQKPKGQQSLTREALAAMSKYSPEDSRAFFARNANDPGGITPSKLKDSNPQEYAERRLAAVAHGILDPTAVEISSNIKPPAPKPEMERPRMALSKQFTDAFNLPEGHTVTLDEFWSMCDVLGEKNAQKIDADAAAHAAAKNEPPADDTQETK